MDDLVILDEVAVVQENSFREEQHSVTSKEGTTVARSPSNLTDSEVSRSGKNSDVVSTNVTLGSMETEIVEDDGFRSENRTYENANEAEEEVSMLVRFMFLIKNKSM